MFVTIAHRGRPSFLKRLYSSALFITDDKANKTFSVLTPHIDFSDRVKDKVELERNLRLRKSELSVDDTISVWKFYKKFKRERDDLEWSRANVAKALKAETDPKEIEKLRTHGRMIRDDLKALKGSYYEVEEKAVLKVLSIPNVLHERTPEGDKVVVGKYRDVSVTESGSHTDTSDIEWTSPDCYYLKNAAAEFELASTFFVADHLNGAGFTQFSNSDFSKSVVVEGCGLDYSDPKMTFTVSEPDPKHYQENSRLHLTGAASLPAFMAHHTKHTIFPSLLPLKYFTVGRKYNPMTLNAKSLLNITQETAVEIFIATDDSPKEMTSEFDCIIATITKLYETLDVHFQISYVPACGLKPWESLRASVEMFSPFLKKYVEVANVSTCDDYVSKRLLFNYGRGVDMRFPKVVSGTVWSVPRILACLIENNELELVLEKCKTM